MKFKRSYVAPLLLVVLLPIWFAANQTANKSTNINSCQSKIEQWNSELWIKKRFEKISLKIIDSSDVGTMLEVSGSVSSQEDINAMRDWFSSSDPIFTDEQRYKGMPIPSSSLLVRYNVDIAAK